LAAVIRQAVVAFNIVFMSPPMSAVTIEGVLLVPVHASR
jgi:hypothetical protein